MDLKEMYMVVASLAVASCDMNAVNIQTEVNTGDDDSNDFLKVIFKQIELLGKRDQEEMNKTISQSHAELASALLRVAPVVTIRGNVTDSARRVTLTFTVTASSLDSNSESAEDGVYNVDWRRGSGGGGGVAGGGGGGLLTPLVATVEPYVIGFAELVFNGILSAVIGNFIEASALGQIV